MSVSRRTLIAASLVTGATALGLHRWFGDDGPGRSHRAPGRSVRLQPLGDDLADQDLAQARRAIERHFGAAVEVLPRLPMPQAAYYPPRRRYRADRLLDALAELPAGTGQYTLGATAVDISWTKGAHEDWGVLGLARIGGSVGVVSSFRCGAAAVGRERASERFGKVAAHELGHCLGLQHCATDHCLMRDAESRVATLDDSRGLCPRCRARLTAPA